jgi:hypothetical protein
MLTNYKAPQTLNIPQGTLPAEQANIQAQPIAETPESFNTVDAKDSITVDDLLGEVSAEAKPSADSVIDESGNVTVQPTPTAPDTPQITKEEAKSKVMAFMKFRDFVQARAFALAGGNINKADEFKMEPWEFQMLCEAYETQVQLIGKVPDWLYIAVTEALILGRRAKMVWDFRKLAKENLRQKQQIEQLKLALARQQGMQQAMEGVQPTVVMPMNGGNPIVVASVPDRPDYKKYWEIDVVNGVPYFVNDGNGKYAAKDKREKVVINETTYPFIAKHNAKELLEKIHA